MRAFVRVLPLLVVAAHLAACADTMARGDAGAVYAAATGPATPGVRKSGREPPAKTLLAPQPSPRCELTKPLEGVAPEQARAARLDYELQCYRQLVDIAHARLMALQDAAAKMRSAGAVQPALLERQPPPQCEPAQLVDGLSPAEARETALGAARQCYQQLEASERQRLAALQDALRTTSASPRGRARRVPRPHYLTY